MLSPMRPLRCLRRVLPDRLGFFADFVIDGVRPTVTFIAPAAPAGPTRSAVTFAVVFSEPVLNVTSDDFAVTTTRTAMGTISSVIPLPNNVFYVGSQTSSAKAA